MLLHIALHSWTLLMHVLAMRLLVHVHLVMMALEGVAHGELIVDFLDVGHIGLGAHDVLKLLAILLVDCLNFSFMFCAMSLLHLLVLLLSHRLAVELLRTERLHLLLLLLLERFDLLYLLVRKSHLRDDVHVDDRIDALLTWMAVVAFGWLMVVVGYTGEGGHSEAENCE